MNSKGIMVLAVVTLAVGAIGMAVVFGLLGGPSINDTFSSTGQQIYYTGADANGPIPRTTAGAGMMGYGMMGDLACVDCHGEDGRGGRAGMMFGVVGIPDIRYSVLSSARSEAGTTMPAWNDDDIARVIRDGVEPDGQHLQAPMPRWSMTDTQIKDVIGYLKELDGR